MVNRALSKKPKVTVTMLKNSSKKKVVERDFAMPMQKVFRTTDKMEQRKVNLRRIMAKKKNISPPVVSEKLFNSEKKE